ncbi:MAG: anaerobic ribonucleoside triphosphate reductase [Eubacteriales bacterium]|nr:anaerobic ribonucleoside triphosphate reductase [Clostridiales bacterium]MDD7301960.1 anaerobic ribonucleoside triphosphate reductase [Eubacteriales bacterium]MDY4433770.1 anaerobic ribonucleoside triphosphate reductase [Candidatus Flemingibacterium sp.]
MITKIIKRDGREAPFNIEKIAKAVFKAAEAAGGHDYNTAMDIACEVANQLEKNCGIDCKPTVEQIQDTVEKVLVKRGHARTAKEYILYRAERTRVREMNSKLMKTYEDLTFKSAKDSDIKRENANIDADTAMGTMLKYGSEGAKQFYEMYVLDPDHAKAHIEGDIHIHDLDFLTLTTTCCQIDIIKLFKGGFSTGHGFLREPKDIQSYSALACIAIQSNQNDQHGGQSIPNFEYGMAPGVTLTYAKLYRKNLEKALDMMCGDADSEKDASDILAEVREKTGKEPALAEDIIFSRSVEDIIAKKYGEEIAKRAVDDVRRYTVKETERATYQAMEALIHNLNTMHSRAGAQIPFSSLNYGMDTSAEGRLVMKSILMATDAGLGNGETPIFPIQIFKVKEGVNYNPGDPNYDLFKLACRVSAKRLFPNFSFVDAPYNLKYYKEGHPETEVAYMGCRTRVMANVYDPTKEITYGRGNLSFTSINLPRIGIRAKGNVDWFFEELDRKIALVIDQLLDRFKIQGEKTVRNYPFLMGQGIWLDSDKLGIDDKVGEVLKHGTLTIGFIGLAECLKALIGKHHGESADAQNLGLEIIGHIRRRADEASRKHGLNFSVIGTPAEGLSGRFVRIDKKKYGIIEGVTDREYYTNSFHIPVYFPITAAEKIKLEAPYHELTNGGHITYVELDGDPLENLDAFEAVIRRMKESGVGYGSINHPVDRDPVCGYTGIIGNECPRCHRTEADGKGKFERIRRITGYLVGTLDSFNDAKLAEVRDRVKHSVDSGLVEL